MRKITKIFLILLFVLICGIVFSKVEAATATITSNKKTANVGETVEVTVSINAASWNLKVTGNASDTIVGYDANGNNVTTTKKYPIKIEKEGNYTVKLTGDVTDTTDKFENINTSVSIQANKATTTPTTPSAPPTTAATITSLTVGGKTYSNPKNDITVNVENETDSIAIKATTSNGEGCSISSTSGSKASPVKLNEGTTNIYLTLASGAKYTVRVQRAAKKVETPPNVIENNGEEEKPEEKKEETKLLLTSLKVKGFDLEPEFNAEVYSYTINIDMDENDVNEVEVEALANMEDAKVEVTGATDLKEGENLVTITVTSADGTKSVVYQLVVNKIVSSSEVVSDDNVTIQGSTQQEEESGIGITQRKIIIVVCVSLIAGLGIFYAVTEYNYGKKKQECYDMFEEEKENRNEDINEDNENDFSYEENGSVVENKGINEEDISKEEAHDYFFKGFQQEEEEIIETKKKTKGKHF